MTNSRPHPRPAAPVLWLAQRLSELFGGAQLHHAVENRFAQGRVPPGKAVDVESMFKPLQSFEPLRHNEEPAGEVLRLQFPMIRTAAREMRGQQTPSHGRKNDVVRWPDFQPIPNRVEAIQLHFHASEPRGERSQTKDAK